MDEEARVAIAEDLVLDFSGLFTGEPPEKQAPESPPDRLEGQQAKKLYLDTKREREDHQRSLEICREYQRNTVESGQLQTDILKGIKAGESVYSLFLKAARAISVMTHNSLFYSQIEADIRAIYGRGLQEKPPLEKELRETRERLQRLIEAKQRETDAENRQRIHRAEEAHRKTITELETMIAKQ